MRRLSQRLARELFQRRDVFEDPDAPPVRAEYQVVLPWMNLDVIHGNGGQVVGEPLPVVAAVRGEIDTDLVADEQQVSGARMLGEDVHRPGRQPVRDPIPAPPVIVTPIHVRPIVVVVVAVERGVHRALAELRGHHPAHVGTLRQIRHPLREIGPRRAAVPGPLEVPVVRSDVQHRRFDRRLGDGRDVAVG